jgi:hypothetical protein
MQSETGTVDYTQIKAIEGKTKVFSEELEEICFKFSMGVVETKGELMGRRNQSEPTRWERQHAIAKLQEWSVYRLLYDHGCSEVDLTIHDRPQYDPDLTLTTWKLHCKSIESTSPYGKSFTFQANFNGKDYDKLFDIGDDYDIIICGVVNMQTRTVEIIDVNLWKDVKPYLKFIKGHDKPDLEGIKLFYDPLVVARERKVG